MSIGSIGSTGSYAFLDKMVMSAMNRSTRSQSTETSAADFAAKIIESEDKNGDGKISTEESRVDSKRFGEIDTDSDGSITSEELQASLKTRENDRLSKGMNSMQGMQGPPPGPPPEASDIAASVMENSDSNGDGVLSASETKLSSDQFNTLDTNGDGKVSAEELAAGIKARQSEMDQQRSAADSTSSSASLTTDSLFKAFFESLSQSGASSAYSDQNNWLYQALQSSSQQFTTTA